MIRVYRQFAERTLLCLLTLRGRVGYDLAHVISYIADRYGEGEEGSGSTLQRQVQRIVHSAGVQEQSIDEMISDLVEQIAQDGQSPGDGDLIDRIVEGLQLPYARNAFSRNRLQELRMALLLPEEMAKVNTRLRQREMTCLSCQHVFAGNEMATIILEGPDVGLYCTRCAKPQFVACDRCERAHVGLNKRLANALTQPWDCGGHEGKSVEEPPQIEGGRNLPPPGAPLRGGHRILEDGPFAVTTGAYTNGGAVTAATARAYVNPGPPGTRQRVRTPALPAQGNHNLWHDFIVNTVAPAAATHAGIDIGQAAAAPAEPVVLPTPAQYMAFAREAREANRDHEVILDALDPPEEEDHDL